MPFRYLTDILVSPTVTLGEILQIYDRHARHTGGIGIVLVVDSSKRLVGVATEGDVRRALLDGADLKIPVSEVMETSYTAASENSTRNHLLQLFDLKIKHIPIVNVGGEATDLVLYHQFQVLGEEETVHFGCRARRT